MNNKFQLNNPSKNFNSYRSIDLEKEKAQAFAFAKRLHEEQVQQIKNSETYKESLKEKQKQIDLDKKYEEEKKKRLEQIKNISNEEIQKSVKIAEEQNKKFKNVLTKDSSVDDIFDTLSNDIKNSNY